MSTLTKIENSDESQGNTVFFNIPRDSSEFTIGHPDIHFVTVPNCKKWFIFKDHVKRFQE